MLAYLRFTTDFEKSNICVRFIFNKRKKNIWKSYKKQISLTLLSILLVIERKFVFDTGDMNTFTLIGLLT